MTVYPNCKINLGLNIVGVRPDGYHDIETVFYPVPLCDRLTVEPAAGETDTLVAEGIPVAGNMAENLVVRVIGMLRRDGFAIPPLDITLEKNIPSGAGLGGGSGDAAAMMRLVNEMFQLGMEKDEMRQRIAELGADCPFFVENRPMFAQGIGDRIEPAEISLSGWFLTLIKPDIFVSTKEAYASVQIKKPNKSIKQIIKSSVETWKGVLCNDFEEPVFARHSAIGRIKETLYAKGAIYASMSGSGSCVYALSRTPIILEGAFGGCFRYQCVL